MTAPIADPKVRKLREVRDLPSLTAYLRDELDWPIADWDIEDLTFTYTAEEAGLDAESALKVNSIRRLRPLSNDAPWGIFFIDFVPGDLPITVLRRILRAVVVKKREAGRPDRQAWQLDDLLFISALGPEGDRDINLARFNEDPQAKVPTLRVVEWDEADTTFHMLRTADELKQLAWRAPGESEADWRARWASAFTLRPRQAASSAKELAAQMASLATRIRAKVNEAMSVEGANGPLRKLFKAFKEVLLHDLTEDGFADMYAQTITYGMFAARRSRPMGITLENAKDMVPSTNPFLRDLLAQFTDAAGLTQSLDFDELGVDALIATLNAANVEAIVDEWGRNRPGEDLVIHFYEDFLKLYDKKQKVQRGVFYTPRPVVSFIVRSVHELLQTEFQLPDGLASTETWGDMQVKFPDLAIPEGATTDTPFVQVLDPAVGTGTFLVEVIDTVYRTMTAKWQKQGFKPMFDFERLWNEYVPKHLLPRIYGFELMMAPYAICHMKVGLKLVETGYRFGATERLHVYLTNSLEPATDVSAQYHLIPPALAHEAHAVNEVKRNTRFTVVVGNPPYSPSICEPEWLMRRLDDWKQGLNETKSDLNREEWKFLRLAQHHCQLSGAGLVGFIINRDFLDGIVKRRMREHLGQSFPLRIAVDLNGDVKGNIADENVFDIEQGVAVVVLCTKSRNPALRYASLVGTREQKYEELFAKAPIDSAFIAFEPSTPYFRWLPPDLTTAEGAADEYAPWMPLDTVFVLKSSGIQTKRDAICIGWTAEEVFQRVVLLANLSVKEARAEFALEDEGAWTVANAQADLRLFGISRRNVRRILYRPLDFRFIYYTHKSGGFLGRPRYDIMRHMLHEGSIGLIFNRQIVGDSVSHFSVSRDLTCHGVFYLGNKGQDYLAPLYLHKNDLISEPSGRGTPNLTPEFTGVLHDILESAALKPTPEDILHYALAVFHSPIYRDRYAEFLKIDFPRLPLTGNPELFRALARLGGELTPLHLVEFALHDEPDALADWPRYPRLARFTGNVRTVAAFPSPEKAWKDGRVTINGTSGFDGVPEDVWNFHIGGYQVCHKWLKDRKGRTLTDEDLLHYAKIVTALHETIRIQKEIDEVIEAHGGWPAAFAGGAGAVGGE